MTEMQFIVCPTGCRLSASLPYWLGEAGLPVRLFVDSLQHAILQIVTIVIW